MDPTIILSILGMAAKYGIPAVESMISEWNKEGPITIDDVKEMEKRFKDPREYFKKD